MECDAASPVLHARFVLTPVRVDDVPAVHPLVLTVSLQQRHTLQHYKHARLIQKNFHNASSASKQFRNMWCTTTDVT